MSRIEDEAKAWQTYAEWLQHAAALRADFRNIGVSLPAPLERAVHDGPAPWKAAPATSEAPHGAEK